MNKEALLTYIADKAYDVGFGASKHFATYDMVQKIPNGIGIITLGAGVFGLAFPEVFTKFINCFLIFIGVLSLYINLYTHSIIKYEKSGVKLIQIFNSLKRIYLRVKSMEQNANFEDIETEINNLENQYYEMSISKQICFSNWYAHYKFFWERQVDWIEEQKEFRFWRDKIPLSFMFFILLSLIIIGFAIYLKQF